MNRTVLHKWLLCFSLLSTSLVTGCTSGPSSSSRVEKPQTSEKEGQKASELVAEGTMVVASLDKMPSFDPYGVSKTESQLNDFESLSYRGLFTRADDQSLTPAIASEYSIDRSKNNPAVVVHLKKGAMWSDGKPVTVDDVIYTFEEYTRPYYYGTWRKPMFLIDGSSEFRRGKVAHMSGISADAKQGIVRISLQRDDISFLQALTAPLLPKHQLAGKSTAQLDQISREGKIIGAGPFQVNTLQQTGWQFAANQHFYGSKPRLNAIRVISLPEEKLTEEVSAGNVHLSWVSPDMASKLAAEGGQEQGQGQDHVQSGAANGYHFIGFNMQSPVLKDLKVRKALAEAISPEEIAKDSFFGLADPVNSPLTPGSFAYQAGSFPAYQPEAANADLASKGYSKEKPLNLTLVYPANPVRERLADSVIKSWSNLPVHITKKALPSDQFVAYLFGGSPTDLYLYSWQYPQDPAELIHLWHSREKVGELGFNASRYQNQQADQLLERGQLLLPTEERKKLFVEWQKLFSADLPIMPLLQIRNNYFVSKHLHGVDEKLGGHPFSKIETMWLE